jgi:hypothetical protein
VAPIVNDDLPLGPVADDGAIPNVTRCVAVGEMGRIVVVFALAWWVEVESVAASAPAPVGRTVRAATVPTTSPAARIDHRGLRRAGHGLAGRGRAR